MLEKIEFWLQAIAIATSVISMICSGGMMTVLGLLFAAFWIWIAFNDKSLRRRTRELDRDSRELVKTMRDRPTSDALSTRAVRVMDVVIMCICEIFPDSNIVLSNDFV
jgi:hypothetical protein